jgi:RecA/RadA recombinase
MIIIDSLTNLYRLELNKDKKEKNYNLNYKLNQMLASLTYLNQSYGIEVLIINELSRKSLDDLLIDVESGGNVMKYWVSYNLKISKTSKLNERKFLFKNLSEKDTIEFIQNLREEGFE